MGLFGGVSLDFFRMESRRPFDPSEKFAFFTCSEFMNELLVKPRIQKKQTNGQQ
jgi:hypothetical protein